MHDPEVYDHPDNFRPERFLKEGQLDPSAARVRLWIWETEVSRA